MIKFIKNLFKTLEKPKPIWIPAELGSVVYQNNPYDFGVCPVLNYMSICSLLKPIYSGFYIKINPDGDGCEFFKEDTALAMYVADEMARQREYLREIKEFIQININCIPKKIIDKYL